MSKKAIIFLVALIAAGIIALLAVTTLGLVNPAASPAASQKNKLQVTTSFYPLYFFASQIGGDLVEVYNVTPAGAEPHDYEPTPQDIARLTDSQLLIINGAHLEPWSDKLKDDLARHGVTVVAAADQLATQQIQEAGQTITDPHVWLAPALAKNEVDSILGGLLTVDPTHAAIYKNNAEKITNKLNDLDTQYQQALTDCASRDIITSHAAFGYLAAAYNLRQVPLTGLSPDEEPSAQKLIDIADFAKKNSIRFIFFESLVSPKLSQTIAREVGAQTLVLNPIEGLSKQDSAAGQDYFSKMAANLTNLRTALQCQ